MIYQITKMVFSLIGMVGKFVNVLYREGIYHVMGYALFLLWPICFSFIPIKFDYGGSYTIQKISIFNKEVGPLIKKYFSKEPIKTLFSGRILVKLRDKKVEFEGFYGFN